METLTLNKELQRTESKRVCAIVVTYNRKEKLIHCLRALKQQIFPLDYILVVNNNSTDGTQEFIEKNGFTELDGVHILNLERNVGGAGGFYEGMKWARQKDYDYFWLMDDDGFPKNDCLDYLMTVANSSSIVCPIVLSDKDSELLAFPYRSSFFHVVETAEDFYSFSLKDFVPIVFPFNGTLISKEIIDEIGFPKKEFFIWGDEREYILRANRAGFYARTYIKAVHFHPKGKDSGSPMFFNLLKFNNPDTDLKFYCYSRNTIWILKEYKGEFFVMLFVLKLLWFNLFTKFNGRRLLLLFKALLDNINSNFTYHELLIEEFKK